MKPLLIFFVILILGVLVFIPIIPVGVENLPEHTLFNFQRTGGIAGFNDNITVDYGGTVFKADRNIGMLDDAELAALNAYISDKKYTADVTSFIGLIKSKIQKPQSYPDMMTVLVRIQNGAKTVKIVQDQFINDFVAQLTGLINTGPTITMVAPSPAHIGDAVEISGNHFTGFEGDRYAWIENPTTGIKGIIYNDAGSTDNLIKFTLKDKYCTADTSYSGKSCPSYLSIVPGEYNVFVYPWGRMSNKVKFIVE
ncbi:MAG TPA: hypothetical protein VL335_02360 [Candidatus Paceibacterota bacterium]|jgi:hypothetical protein|nr:hypothetical protein [Candidatus Paceibacterota bacterium]